MSKDYNQALIPLARSLRKNMTKHEKKLWYDFLCHYHVKFQRQKVIGNHIADFYCDTAKLVIEVDGVQHRTLENKEKDQIRTDCLSQQGITVIRFTNEQIEKSFDWVAATIDKTVKNIVNINAFYT